MAYLRLAVCRYRGGAGDGGRRSRTILFYAIHLARQIFVFEHRQGRHTVSPLSRLTMRTPRVDRPIRLMPDTAVRSMMPFPEITVI